MNTIRKVAVAAVSFLCLVSGSVAQQFDTSPDYRAYRPQQVPTVGLPSMRTGGYTLQEQPSSRRQTTTPTTQANPWASPAVETGRRTDAGAIRKNGTAQETAKTAPDAPATPTQALPAGSSAENTLTAGTILEGVPSIYDGQNLVVDGVAVRLDGAEAPALKQQCLTSKALVWPCGQKAATRLKEYVAGRKVRCVVQTQIGDGAAAICSGNGVTDFAAGLVRDGLAVSNGHDKGRYAEAQATARSIRAGMWVGTFEAPWTWRIKNGQ